MSAEGFEEFVAIVDSGSLTAAATALALPRPTLSKRLARLEERLGVRLLHRTTRKQTLTRHGELLYPKAVRVVQAAQEAEDAVQRIDDVPRGRLRVAVPSAVPSPTFAGWLVEFLESNPKVTLDLVGSDSHVDLVAEGFDMAMRQGPVHDTSLVGRTLVTNTLVAVASPTYLEEFGVPKDESDLVNHNCIVGYTGLGIPNLKWPLCDGGAVDISGNFATNLGRLRQEAAKLHLGITLSLSRTVQEDLDSGALVTVLPDIVGRKDYVRLVYPDREFLEPKVRAFVDLLIGKVRGRPPQS